MNNNLNKSVLDKILNCIPENIKPVNYLMDILDPVSYTHLTLPTN